MCTRAYNLDVIKFISPRLKLLKTVFGGSRRFSLEQQQISELWNLLSSADEQEALLDFLQIKPASTTEFTFKEVCSEGVLEYCFHELICKADFATMGLLGFKCFEAYYIEFNRISTTSDGTVDSEQNMADGMPLSLVEGQGLQALWNIVIHGKDEINREASSLLLDTYECYMESPIETVESVCKHFVSSALKHQRSLHLPEEVLRCVDVVRRFVRPSGTFATVPPCCWLSTAPLLAHIWFLLL